MNNKGFTLIELIMVIAILALIALISTPNVIKLINKSKVDNYNGVIDSIVEAAEIYVSDNRYDLVFYDSISNIGNSTKVSFCKPAENKNIYTSVNLGTLIDKKNLKSTAKDADNNETIANPCNNEPISRNTTIKITLDCKTKQFSYDIAEENSGNTIKRRKDDEDNDISGLEGIKIPDGSNCSDLY